MSFNKHSIAICHSIHRPENPAARRDLEKFFKLCREGKNPPKIMDPNFKPKPLKDEGDDADKDQQNIKWADATENVMPKEESTFPTIAFMDGMSLRTLKCILGRGFKESQLLIANPDPQIIKKIQTEYPNVTVFQGDMYNALKPMKFAIRSAYFDGCGTIKGSKKNGDIERLMRETLVAGFVKVLHFTMSLRINKTGYTPDLIMSCTEDHVKKIGILMSKKIDYKSEKYKKNMCCISLRL